MRGDAKQPRAQTSGKRSMSARAYDMDWSGFAITAARFVVVAWCAYWLVQNHG